MARKKAVEPAVKTVEATEAEAIETKTEDIKAEDAVAETTEKAAKPKKAPAKRKTAKDEPEKKEAPVKKETVKAKAAVKESIGTAAKKAEVKNTLYIQYAGKSMSEEDLIKSAKDIWKYDLKRKAGELESIELYVKPEENKVYYVMNEDVKGCFDI